MHRLLSLTVAALACMLPAAPVLAQASGAQGAGTMVALAPHRAVYDLSLVSSRGPKAIDAARGRIAFDFSGDACTGYALSFRQVTVLQTSESGSRTSDLRTTTFEDGKGKSLRFKSETRFDTAPPRVIDGEAVFDPKGRFRVDVRKPVPEKAEGDGDDLVFPTGHLARIIQAARAGETTLTVRVFDGSDDGKKIYDTLTVIGKRIPAGQSDATEPAAQAPALRALDRWPVSISYFAPGEGERTPVYVIGFDLYENGISRALRIDYGDFSLRGDMKQLDLLPASDCRPKP